VADKRTDRRTDRQNYDSQDRASIAASRGNDCGAMVSHDQPNELWDLFFIPPETPFLNISEILPPRAAAIDV